MFAMAEEWYFDGETWDIPWQFKDRRCWWFDE
jgi:hypothetical protein